MSIVKFGKRQKFPFSNVGQLRAWAPDMVPAVFALTYRREPAVRPKAHTVIYFGVCNDMSKQPQNLNQDVCDWWEQSGGKLDDICVFVHAMPGSTEHDRIRVRSQLIAEYSPHGNF